MDTIKEFVSNDITVMITLMIAIERLRGLGVYKFGESIGRQAIWFLALLTSASSIGLCSLCAQPPVTVPLPHEVVQGNTAEQAKEIGPKRDWRLTDAPTFSGTLLQWSEPSGLIFFHNQFGSVSTYPLRQFDDEGRKTIEQVLGPHRELISRLRDKEIVQRPKNMSLGQGEGLEQAFPIDATDDSVYWRAGETFLRSPVAHFAARDVEELRNAVQARDSVAVWHGKQPNYRFRAELIGQTRFGGNRTAYVFRGFRFGSHYFTNLEFLVSQDHLSVADQKRAGDLLAAMPGKAVLKRNQATQWWWPLGHQMQPPQRPVGFEGDVFRFERPILIPENREQLTVDGPIKSEAAEMPLSTLTPSGELLARQLVEEERLKAESRDIDDQGIAKALNAFTEKTIAERPLYFVSPTNLWILRDSNPFHVFSGRLVAAQGLYWIFSQDNSPTTFAVLKSEIADEYLPLGESTIREVTSYLAKHPDLPRPNLATKVRITRLIPHSLMLCEPVGLVPPGQFEVKGIDTGGTTTLDRHRLHFLDAQELQLVLGGDTSSQVEVGPVASSAAPGDQLIAANQLRELAKVERSWTLSKRASGTSDGSKFGFLGVLQGRHQDDLLFRRGDVDFVVDPDLLDDRDRAEAEQLLQKRIELEKRAGEQPRASERPKLRMWGYQGARSILGRELRFNEDGLLVFFDPNDQEVQIHATLVTPEFRCELTLQEQLDKSFRQTARADLTADELKRIEEQKQQIRQTETERLVAEAAANALDNWRLKDILQIVPGRFVRFDGDDVIMKSEHGMLVRILKVAFTDESMARLEELAADPDYQKRIESLAAIDPSQVTLRVFRSLANTVYLPGTPVNFNPRSMTVETSSGTYLTYALDKIHPRDVSELRSLVYLKAKGLKRDEHIDERLKQPIDPKEVLRGPVALSPAWRKRLDEMLEPRELVWKQNKLPTLPGESVIGISSDGSHVILDRKSTPPATADVQPASTKRALRILEVRTGKAQTVSVTAAPGSPVFLTGDHREIIVYDDGVLKQIDLASGKLSFSVDDLKAPPLAASQSGEGNHLVLLLSEGRILFVSTRDKKSEIVQMKEGRQFSDTPSVWCASDGTRFVVRLQSHLQAFSVAKETGEIKPDNPITGATDNSLIALERAVVLVGDPEQTQVAVIGPLNDKRVSSADFATGLKPVWIGVERVGDEPMLHVIGKQADKLSAAAEYSLSAWIGLDRRVQYTTQSIDGQITADSMFAPSGRVVAFMKNDEWHVATQGKLSDSPLQPIADITGDLIAENSLDQIDAAWTHLRTEPFQQLGEYPDQAAETFFDLMSRDISMYGWEHGGDLEARADLLLDRWEKLAPKSLFVPTLKAMRERDRAWKARGFGYADTVTEQGAKEFRERMLAVAGLLKPLFKEKHPPTRAFSLAFDVSMSLGLPLEVTKNLNKVMMQTPVKYSPPAHSAVVLLLLPRWHGNPGDSEHYITSIANQLGGDTGDRMYAQLLLYAARYHPSDQPLSVHLQYDAERLLRGLKVYYAKPQSAAYLQRTLNIFATEEYWDLYKQALQLQTEARVFYDEIDADVLAQRQLEQGKALKEN